VRLTRAFLVEPWNNKEQEKIAFGTVKRLNMFNTFSKFDRIN
jgi:hypothetical protein